MSARLLNRIGPRATAIAGAMTTATGYISGIWLSSTPWQLTIVSMLALTGSALAFAAFPALILGNVPARDAGSGLGVNSLMRVTGITAAGAVLAAILTSQTVAAADGLAIPSWAAFQASLLIGAAVALCSTIPLMFMPRANPLRG